ncbi:hypothetical protein GGD63_006144 [Bradyrhizobium sp. cir1]|uniref:hypothetical protein n=1 Tax=Bradyrhizobium sp. cir1 TaxID=1445730 RepID=UPI001606ACD5|nr:hypothetical protein [Bradyrhizobium sp. cir1]MBB4373322.1 hypothetical protein [Bradyrhizobium sp. cir1]
MRWVFLLAGLLLGFVGGAGTIIYLQTRTAGGAESGEMAIHFDQKMYYDSDAFVVVSGTLTGPDMAYPNNTYNVSCYQELKQCWSSNVEAIGERQIGRLGPPSEFDIRSWTKNEIVAGYDSPFGCYKTTITISRTSQVLLWVEEPVNQTKPFCKDAKKVIRKMTIEDSPSWKRLHQR